MTARRFLPALALLALPGIADAASKTQTPRAADIATIDGKTAKRYQAIIDQLKDHRWDDARAAIAALDGSDSVRPYLLAQLYLDKDSPRTDLFDLLDLLAKAPYLPQADQLGRLAAKRGAQILPDKPQIRQLAWLGAAPQRRTLRAVKDDPIADAIRNDIIAHIVNDDPAGAETILTTTERDLTDEGGTELRHRIAWSYYLVGDTTNARRMAANAVRNGSGEFVPTAWWTMGLAAWRDQDWSAAATAFYEAAQAANDGDMRSGSYFWAARATMADGYPERVSGLLRAAARDGESFYGLLARETLGVAPEVILPREAVSTQNMASLKSSANVRNAVIFAALGQTQDAELSLRHEAEISGSAYYGALVHLAGDLNMPTTQLWLAHRTPSGAKAGSYDRFPAPDWTPVNGWQVDKALVFAHTLQESRFQADARSPADARGVMQVLPGTGRELANEAGITFSSDGLYDPEYNMALGQLYLRKLAAMPATGGLLPKVVAAYNAGPTPVDRWNVQVRDDGDPLLFIESVPYYETRAYLNAVLRNYFVYQMEDQGSSAALTAMAQGLWTRFPDGKKTVAVRMTPTGRVSGAD